MTMQRYDRRRHRATQLTAAIMRKVGHLVEDRREFHDLLFELFHQEGYEVISDYDRAEMGLPPRGPDGWTLEEIAAVEQVRLEVILSALPSARRSATPSTTSPDRSRNTRTST